MASKTAQEMKAEVGKIWLHMISAGFQIPDNQKELFLNALAKAYASGHIAAMGRITREALDESDEVRKVLNQILLP